MIESNSRSKLSAFFRRKPKDVKLDMNGNGMVLVHVDDEVTTPIYDPADDPMASVSIRVRNEDGDDFVVSPSDVVDNINEARKSKSVRDAEPGLRSMLYGLSQKQEKEEAEAKKLAKKMISEWVEGKGQIFVGSRGKVNISC
ncbi:hypothetical protein CAEBREN_23599 [Caenorhabditis brenneri]|uniref:Uncharacterized protein n=1 Tax=Caenorhabditis brenneri TaxID=135651 RepID=G0N430_CAEBE|nr:hypothetical protein CAEBREN_23599 [Caenorhabditis brenneri]